jgi:hypothetical protein
MKIKARQVTALSGPPEQSANVKSIWAVPSTEDLFWLKVDKNGPLMPKMDTNCWVWTGATDSDGYGVFAVKRRLTGAHRFGYVIQNGDIPDGHLIMHRCNNPPCVRGGHLDTGTNAENLAQMAQEGRSRGGRRKKDGSESANRLLRGSQRVGIQRSESSVPPLSPTSTGSQSPKQGGEVLAGDQHS